MNLYVQQRSILFTFFHKVFSININLVIIRYASTNVTITRNAEGVMVY